MNRTTAAALLLSVCGFCAVFDASAQNAPKGPSIFLSGTVGTKALLVIDGAQPKMVAPGETFKGVKVVSAGSDQAIVEIDGKRHTLHMGDAAISMGGTARESGSKIVLQMERGGHFFSLGSINNQSVQFIVDTGASVVSMGVSDAERLGINWKNGQRIMMNTANGSVVGYRLTLNSVRVGDVEVFNVDAVVGQMSMPYVLLGNSFLSRFSMRRDSDQMVLERRY